MIKILVTIAVTVLLWLPLSLFWLGVKRTLLVNHYVLWGFCIAMIIIALLSLFLPRPERYDVPPFALWGVLLVALAGVISCFQIGLWVYQYANNQPVIKTNGYFLIAQIIIMLAGLYITTNDYSFAKNPKSQLNTAKLHTTPDKSTLVKRYFLGNSDLHKQQSDKPTYLYEEITEAEAIKNENERAYYIGYFQNGILIKYEKRYRGEILFEKQIKLEIQ